MSLQHEFNIIREIQYQAMLGEQKVIAEIAKQSLLAFQPEDLNSGTVESEEEIEKGYSLAWTVYEYFRDTIFFHDAETIKKLQQLSPKPDVLNWFISLKDIHDQYEFIRKNDIQIDALLAFDIIKIYLASKVLKELNLIALPTTRDGIVITQGTNELINLKSRRKYYHPNPVKSKSLFQELLDTTVNEIIAIPVEEVGMKKFDIKTVIDMSRGNTESIFLKPLLEECFEYDRKTISKTKFLSILYGLFKIILEDGRLITESDFDDTERRYLAYKSFQSFQAKKLRSIIYPKRKTE